MSLGFGSMAAGVAGLLSLEQGFVLRLLDECIFVRLNVDVAAEGVGCHLTLVRAVPIPSSAFSSSLGHLLPLPSASWMPIWLWRAMSALFCSVWYFSV